MEKLEKLKECLVGIVEEQVYGNIAKVDAKELGEVVDMIKDLSEAMYYCTITEAMESDEWKEEKKPRHKENLMYYPKRTMYMKDKRPEYDVEYPESVNHVYRDGEMRDPHEGRSGRYRRMYMSGKGVKDKTHQMQELEQYMQELASDMTEMIQDASQEEKQLLQTKLSNLIQKIK